jgi:diguanylate cyclase (GGDEF)-like protein
VNNYVTGLQHILNGLTTWIIASLALQGVVTLSAAILHIVDGKPHLTMIISVGLAIAVWHQVSKHPAPAPPSQAVTCQGGLKTRPDSRDTGHSQHSLLNALAAPGSRNAAANESSIDELITESFQLQLKQLRQAHQLTTVAVLWADFSGNTLLLRGIDSQRTDLNPGPFPMGSGIVGALLKGQDEIAMAPVRTPLCGLPYYREQTGVGSLLVIRITGTKDADRLEGILCVDRCSEEPWTDSERQSLRLAARKLGLEAAMATRLQFMNEEWTAIRQVCISMHELNQGLGLEAAFNATIKAVRSLVSADFIAISLVQGNSHSTLCAEGAHADQLLGIDFPIHAGLVGQVLKLNCALPEGAVYSGASPVFSDAHRFADFRSLRILPLRKEGEAPIGALTVANRKPHAFSRQKQELLELIAAQVAIKIDLAQAHEKINNMAITDSLTGLANHRAFMHGFEIMINRTQRNESMLALLMCDVDLFKGINDRYGHPFGDQVLKQVAERLGQNVRVIDLAARYGGEEFVILLEDSDRAGAQIMAERLRKQVESLPLHHHYEKVRVTISIGIAVYPTDGEGIQKLIDCADQALYHAKASGRNCSVTWTSLQQDRARVKTA